VERFAGRSDLPRLGSTTEPQLTAEQIVANSDANIERIKNELKLTPEQEKHWTGFNSAIALSRS
jgi:hypothetical protein